MNATVGMPAVFGAAGAAAGAAGGMLPRPRRVTAALLPAPVILFVLLKRERRLANPGLAKRPNLTNSCQSRAVVGLATWVTRRA
jgi:hypothetical protein